MPAGRVCQSSDETRVNCQRGPRTANCVVPGGSSLASALASPMGPNLAAAGTLSRAAPKHTSAGSRVRYWTIRAPAPEHTTGGPQRSEYSIPRTQRLGLDEPCDAPSLEHTERTTAVPLRLHVTNVSAGRSSR